MKKLILMVAILMVSITLIGCGSSDQLSNTKDNYQTIMDRGYIVVGMECAYAPFNWTVSEANKLDGDVQIEGTNNYADGYDVMVARQVAQSLGVSLRIKAIEWDGLIPSLTSTMEIDMIIAGMSPTAERAQTVAFSDMYYESQHVVLLRADSPYANATSINDFAGAKVVGQLSTIYDDLIDQMTGAIHENPLGDIPTIITGINQGVYDATVLELPVAEAVVAANPDLTYIQFTEGNGFDVSYEDKVVSIALRQNDIQLLAHVNTALSGISSSDREQMMLSAIEREPK